MEQLGDLISQPSKTIASQKDETTIIGQGRLKLTEKQHFNPFPDIDYDNSQGYLKHLYKVWREFYCRSKQEATLKARAYYKSLNKRTGTH